MTERKFNEIDARLAAIEANLMAHDALLVEAYRWLSMSPDGEAFKDAMSIQLESEAARFAAMPVDNAGRYPAIAEALRGLSESLSKPLEPDGPLPPEQPNLRLVQNN